MSGRKDHSIFLKRTERCKGEIRKTTKEVVEEIHNERQGKKRKGGVSKCEKQCVRRKIFTYHIARVSRGEG